GYAVFLIADLGRLAGKTPLERTIDLTHDVIGLTLCTSLWLVVITRSIRDRYVLTTALVTEVLLVAVISTAVPWAGFIRTDHVSSLTWAVPIIILFSLLVPLRPATTLRVSALCALTMPAGLWLLDRRGLIEVRGSDLL